MGPLRHDEPLVLAAVVHLADPFADHLLQLVQEEERLVLEVEAAAVHIGPQIGGQVLDQALAQGLEEPLHGRFVGGLTRLRGLDGDAYPGAHADHVCGQERPPVVDHQRLRRAHPLPQQRCPPAVRAVWTGGWGLFLGWCESFEQHPGHVHRLGGDRAHPKPHDGAREQVLGHCQLRPHPPAGDRFHRVHVQVLGVEHRVLAGPYGPQPTVDPHGTVSDRAPVPCAARDRVGALGQLTQPTVGRGARGQRHHPDTVAFGQPGPDTSQHR